MPWHFSLSIAVAVLAIVGCSDRSQDDPPLTPSAAPLAYRVSPDTDKVFLNESVRFSLVDIATGEVADDARWRITSPHNVPGDRGVMRSDGLYTAPRRPAHIVTLAARFQKIEYPFEFFVFDPRYPDPDATTTPGQTHSILDFHEIETTRPIENGLPVGESVGFSVTDGSGRPLIIDHIEVQQDNRVVDHAGTITSEGVYTAPLEVPDPPTIRLAIFYFREGAHPPSLSMIGPSITIVPAN